MAIDLWSLIAAHMLTAEAGATSRDFDVFGNGSVDVLFVVIQAHGLGGPDTHVRLGAVDLRRFDFSTGMAYSC